MKKITLVLAILCSIYSFGQVGTIFTSGSLKYKITAATTVEVSSNTRVSGTIVIPATVNYNSANYQVTSIGNQVFLSYFSLTSVTIPNSVPTIGEYAHSINR